MIWLFLLVYHILTIYLLNYVLIIFFFDINMFQVVLEHFHITSLNEDAVFSKLQLDSI